MINSIIPDVNLIAFFRGEAPFILTDLLRLTILVVFSLAGPVPAADDGLRRKTVTTTVPGSWFASGYGRFGGFTGAMMTGALAAQAALEGG